VVVVDPEGRVSWATSVFREIDPTAYEELAAAVAAVAPSLEAEEEDDDAQAAASAPLRQQDLRVTGDV
jgi:hypothetical protein